MASRARPTGGSKDVEADRVDDLEVADEVSEVALAVPDDPVEVLDPVARLLGVVRVGDRDGDAARAVRLLGLGDGLEFTELAAERVRVLQEAHELPVTGVVDAATWPVLLPVLRLGDVLPEVVLVRLALEVPGGARFDAELESALRFAQAEEASERTGVVDAEIWSVLLKGRM